ncbi:MAG: hypothetical protein FWD73_15095 [Polyangiaceae bacterium]|nr:hypothetical protein [Polyangiaceae bacterium]
MSGQTDDDITQWEKAPPEEVLNTNLKDLDKEDEKNLDVRYLQPDDLTRVHAAPQDDELTRVHTLPMKTLPLPIKKEEAEKVGTIIPVPVVVPPEHRLEPLPLTKAEAANNNTEVVSRPTKTLPGIGGPEPEEPPKPPKANNASKANQANQLSEEITQPCMRVLQEQAEQAEKANKKRVTRRDKIAITTALTVIVGSVAATIFVSIRDHDSKPTQLATPTALVTNATENGQATPASVANANPVDSAFNKPPGPEADPPKAPVETPKTPVAAKPSATATATSNASPNTNAVASTNRVNVIRHRGPRIPTNGATAATTNPAPRAPEVMPTVDKPDNPGKFTPSMDWRGEM